MWDNFPLLSLITFSPLLGILILLFVPKHLGFWIKTIAIVTTLIPLGLSAWLYAVSYTHLTLPTNREV